jgi:tetratricopeptide (TPR) repeat protein
MSHLSAEIRSASILGVVFLLLSTIAGRSEFSQSKYMEAVRACSPTNLHACEVAGSPPSEANAMDQSLAPLALKILAETHMRAGQFNDAIKVWDTLIDRARKYETGEAPGYYYVWKATCYFKLGQNDSALSTLDGLDAVMRGFNYNQSLVEGKNLMGASLRGDIAMATQKYDAAVRYYEGYAKYYRNESGTAEKLATARKMAGQPSSAPNPAPTSEPVASPAMPSACKMFPNLC